jgi:hypothetical protein
MGTSPCVNVFLALDTWLYHYNVLVCYRTYLVFKIESNYVVISPEALLLLSDKSFNLDQLSLAVQWENVFFSNCQNTQCLYHNKDNIVFEKFYDVTKTVM